MRRSLLVLLILSLVTACGGNPTDPRSAVLVIQDGSVPDAREVVSPAVLAAEVALEERGLRSVIADTRGREAEALRIVTAAAADPTIVGVIVAPFTVLPVAARDALFAAGLAVASLSSIGSAPDVTDAWRRLVPSVDDEAVALLQVSPGATSCVAGEGSPASRALADAVRARGGPTTRSLGGPPAVAASLTGSEGCRAIIWTGSAPGAIAFRDALAVPIPIVLGSAARTTVYLETAWPAAEGTVGVCGCADLTTNADEASQGFVHAYQAATGLDPGPFAVEGADAVDLLLGPGEVGGREDVAGRVAGATSLQGLVTRYTWDPAGDPDPADVRIYRVTGVRWLMEPGALPA